MLNEAEVEADIVHILKRGPIYEGQFEESYEVAAIHRLVGRGDVERFYAGTGGWLGLAQIRLS